MTQETEGEHPHPLDGLDDDDLDFEEIDFEELGDVGEADAEGPPREDFEGR
jgi:hypothetical protein